MWDVVSYLIVPTKWSAEEEVNDVVHDTMQEETTKQPTLSDIDKYKNVNDGYPKTCNSAENGLWPGSQKPSMLSSIAKKKSSILWNC